MPEELESCVISPYQDTFSGKDLTKHIQGMTALVVRESGARFFHAYYTRCMVLMRVCLTYYDKLALCYIVAFLSWLCNALATPVKAHSGIQRSKLHLVPFG